jgi:uncharacterized membrane protein YphA (DoxX/SURF4 family)
MKKVFPWLLVIFIAFVFIQSLVFKFSGSQETVIIFNTVADWMTSIGLPAGLVEGFRSYTGIVIGGAELVASILLFISKTRIWGALLAMGIMSGAIFFHLATPLGVDRAIDDNGATDGGVLFFVACGVWIAAAVTTYLNRKSIGNMP